ncbi:MAG: hypothetical protein ACREX8_13090, partial [Gammaproteobacteria bacterium]
MRVSTHADVFDAPAARIGPLELGGEGGRSGARSSRLARPSRLAALPGRWCGTERSSDDRLHAVGGGGPRVKVVYAYPKGAPDRFDLYKDLIQQDVALTRSAVAAASGGRKTIRFDMGTDCPGGGARYVDIQTMALPHDAAWYGVDPESAATTIWSEVRRSLGLRGRWNATLYVDGVSPGGAAGIASQPLDETKGPSNDANLGGQSAFVFGDGSPEFSPRRSQVFVHETIHTLGAVQDGAPHSTGLGHCFDGADVMCYDDGGPTAPQPRPEPTCAGPLRIDCGGDDYFSPRPARGSYLARHWNLFDSAFMCPVPGCDSSDPDASVAAALSASLGDVTSRLRRAGLPGLLRRGTLRLRFQAPQPGRLGLTIAVGRRKLLAGHRAVGRA